MAGRVQVGREDVNRFIPLGVLALLVVGVSIAEPGFASLASARVVTDEAAVILLLAAGQTMVILLGGIDLSVAALASLCGVLFARWVPEHGVLGIFMVLALATTAGAIQGLVHVRAQLPSFIVTLGGLGVFSGAALSLSGESTVQLRENYELVSWAADRVLGVPAGFVFALAVVAVLASLSRRLPFGRHLRAIGSAEPVALMSGVRAKRVKVAAFAISGLCASLAALLLVARLSAGSPSQADALLLPAIAAVVVGGTAITGGVGSVGRTLVGALIIAVLRVGMSVAGVPAAYEQLVYGALVIAAVAVTIDRAKLAAVK
jgi:ribose transport system permease protein